MKLYHLLTHLLVSSGDKDDMDAEDADPNAGRFVRYQFTPQFLKLKTVGATYVGNVMPGGICL